MDLSLDEIRTMLAICVRGLRHFRENPKNYDFKTKEMDQVHNIESKIEEAYDDLYPFAPDVGGGML
jgi:hypothetical protein